MATGALALYLTPAVGARTVSGEVDTAEDQPDEDLDDVDDQDGTEDQDDTEDQTDDQDGTEEGTEDSGNHLGQRKDEITPDPSLIAAHDNGKHTGLVKERTDDKVRGVGYWANLTGAKGKKKTK